MEREAARIRFDNLGQLAQRVAALNSQFQSMRRDTRFQKSITVAEAYNPYSAMKRLPQLNGIGAKRQ